LTRTGTAPPLGHLDGGAAPIVTFVEEGLRPLRRIWTDNEVAAEGP